MGHGKPKARKPMTHVVTSGDGLNSLDDAQLQVDDLARVPSRGGWSTYRREIGLWGHEWTLVDREDPPPQRD